MGRTTGLKPVLLWDLDQGRAFSSCFSRLLSTDPLLGARKKGRGGHKVHQSESKTASFWSPQTVMTAITSEEREFHLLDSPRGVARPVLVAVLLGVMKPGGIPRCQLSASLTAGVREQWTSPGVADCDQSLDPRLLHHMPCQYQACHTADEKWRLPRTS